MTKRKIKKKSDLWDTFRNEQRLNVDVFGAVLGNALNNRWREGYVTALCEFGVITEADKVDCIGWCPK